MRVSYSSLSSWLLPALLAALLAARAAGASPLAAAAAREGDEILGTRPPEWSVTHWIGSEPLTLEGLRGRVVLVRFWTAPGCPFCAVSAPALEAFHRAYRDQGLTVVGLYHHKSPGKPDPEEVARLARDLGFTFPVAIDPGWRTLRAWWLDGRDRAWTSATFLLDRDGAVRHVHPGGQYVEGDADHDRLRSAIEGLLGEGGGPGGE